MHEAPTVAVLAALDTKAEEAEFVCEQMRAHGVVPLLVDFGVLGEAGLVARVDRAAVAAAAGADLANLRLARDPGVAGRTMASGLRRMLGRLHTSGAISGVLALGGAKGTAIACEAMRGLPFGVPRVMVTTAASGDTRRFIGSSHIVLVPTVADLLGLNRITRPVLAQASSMVTALVRTPRLAASGGPAVAVSSFGVTTACASRVRAQLIADRYEVVVFPASGIGGEAMEALIGTGEVSGVIDLTTTELADDLVGGTCSAGPRRLESASAAGIPQVVSLGALDMVNFGPASSVPAAFAQRQLYQHGSAVTLMRTSVDENRQLGELLARKLNRASGPTAVVVPGAGFSDYDRPGGPFFDPDADRACILALEQQLAPHIRLVRTEAHINDPGFASLLVETYRELASPARGLAPAARIHREEG
jgi:uncharacterized protein (UPF0261 family)